MNTITEDAQACMVAFLRALGLQPVQGATIVLHLDTTAQLGTVEMTTRLRSHKNVAAVERSAHTAPQSRRPNPMLAGA